ncbi:hypothetical protein [Nocardiopsis synnemataformans]|uniref:hypothetical protein n=1 Tax=Nocardiopsis synnemataformans TaxID=61305 RepID=UPI003EB9AC57
MAHPDPQRRSANARLAAHESWAKTPDRSKRTAKARAALEEKWLRQVDPDGLMDPDQRRLAAESARKAHYQRASRAGHAARWGKRDAA